jgi:hypothetical protein
MIKFLNARLARTSNQEGFALVLVIAIGAILMILSTVAVTTALATNTKSATDVSGNAAEAAAYAGIEEYESRLATNSSYFQYGNPSATFGAGSTLTLPTGAQTNPAFGIGTSGTWATVAGSSGTAKFRYEVDTTQYLSTGVIRIRSTGLAGKATRSIIAFVKQQGFLDFLYFTDYEIQDPNVSGQTGCVAYAWAGRSSSCTAIQFAAADHIQGPLHSNDTLNICGSTFDGIVTTGNTKASGGIYYTIPSSCGAATFNKGQPSPSAVVGLPATNSQMKAQVRSDIPATVPKPGCLFTGPTSIVFNSDGSVTVKSPWTIKTQVSGDPATSGTTPSACGVPGTGSNGMNTSNGSTFTPNTGTVMYVQNVPTVAGDPNRWGASTPAGGYTCTGVDGKTTGNGIGYPMNKEVAPSGTPYGCTNGDVFVKGNVKGQYSVAAENYVYVTGNILYGVWVYNPDNSSNATRLTDTNREIDSAILSVAHTFQVQNYSVGSARGTLTVSGAIAQKYRGTVATSSNGTIVTGYAKNYVYDARLKYSAPPDFLSPVTTTYGVTTWIDTAPAFTTTGAYK